ncbi:MAG: metalloprotease PmbA [Betaproteobacteria bacterium]
MTDPQSRFTMPSAQLREISAAVLARARQQGATGAETEVSQGFGQGVTVRKGEVETIEYNRDKGVSVTVYVGQRRGHASSADTSPAALDAAVDKALTIARYTEEDTCAGLADPERLARDIPDLDLYHPWNVTVDEAIEIAQRCESAATGVDPRVTNSEGATVSAHEYEFVYANSAGFTGGYRTSRHSISCSVIAEDNGSMQRDYWYTSSRLPGELEAAESVGRAAGERTVRRLNARQLATTSAPVLFEAPIASSLIGHFVGAISGGSLYRKSSFLLDSVGQQVFAPHIRITELPHLPRGVASAPFDDEGVTTVTRDVVRDGIVQGYFLGSYSGRKLGLPTTGNAGGSHNLIVSHGDDDFAAMLRRLGTGLLVTELLGQGVNPVTGDYSRGAAGFWVENGEIAYPVEEITIAGNLREMYQGIVAVGSDVDRRGGKQIGSILVGNMTIAGA